MAHMSLHYLYNQKIISLHMDVKERTACFAFSCDGFCAFLSEAPFLAEATKGVFHAVENGGPGWTRTSDPTLIKRVL